jgi:serine/threonine protein kinase
VLATNLENRFVLPEIINHKSLRHQNVVEFLDAFFIAEDKQLWVLRFIVVIYLFIAKVVLEYMPGGNLTSLLTPDPTTSEFKPFSEKKIAYVCREVNGSLLKT